MRSKTWLYIFVLVFAAGGVGAQAQRQQEEDLSEFGPIVRAYLGYLKNEQEVVDARESRHEINRAYYIRNSNRIRALRQMAIRIARETRNDYLPELEAAANDELVNLFERPPRPASLRVGEIYSNTFRFLGTVRSGSLFYIFARLDPYEQAELIEKEKGKGPAEEVQPAAALPPASTSGEATSRPRRVGTP
ncbi:MAG TPA: hypothetical protein VF791_19560 [Pyrinomonadaceae bacterium]